MNKIWYIIVNEKQEGPFSAEELKKDLRLTPDTRVWREGWKEWKAIRDVPELKSLFEEWRPPAHLDEEVEGAKQGIPQDELVLDFGEEPPYLSWLLVALVSLLYVLFRLYGS